MELNPEIRELDHRPKQDGIEKFLLWHSDTNLVSMVLIDEKESKLFAFEVPNDQALEAFKHPFIFKPETCEGIELHE